MAVYISFRDHPESQDASQVTCLMRAQAFHGDFDGILAYVRNRLSWQIEFTSENCLCTKQKRVRAIDSHVKVFVYVRLCTLACKSSPKHVYIELCHWVSVLKFNLKFDTLYVGWWLALLDDGTNCLLHTHTHTPQANCLVPKRKIRWAIYMCCGCSPIKLRASKLWWGSSSISMASAVFAIRNGNYQGLVP